MSNAVATALYGTLVADSTLTTLLGGSRVYQDMAPQGSDYPFVVFGLITAPDAYTFGGRAWTDGMWQIRAYDASASSALAGSVMDRVDALLTDQTLTVGGTAALVVRRTESLPNLPEVNEAGQPIRSAGARFQIGVGA